MRRATVYSPEAQPWLLALVYLPATAMALSNDAPPGESIRSGAVDCRMSRFPATRGRRWLVAIVIGIASAAMAVARYMKYPERAPDFLQVWYSARAMLRGLNPYDLVGPGLAYEWGWPLFYPATAMVAAMPVAYLPAMAAIALFIGGSTTLLAYGVTQNGWHRLWLFCSMPYVVALFVSQWSPVFTAALVLPPLAMLFAVKPNLGLALFLATHSTRVQCYAIAGGAILTVISLAFDPGWPADWLRSLGEGAQRPAITRLGGPLILLALLRWRRPEARLIVALACVPQYAYWYEVVPLLMVPSTRVETLAFSLVTSLGWNIEHMLASPPTEALINQQVGALMVFFAYLPAVWIVMRRPNEGPRAPLYQGLEQIALRIRAVLSRPRRTT